MLEQHCFGDVYVLACAKLRIRASTKLAWQQVAAWTESGGRTMKLWKRAGKWENVLRQVLDMTKTKGEGVLM